MRARLDLKYWIPLIIKDLKNLKEYRFHIKSRGLKEFYRDNSGYRNSKYTLRFKRSPHGMVHDGVEIFEEKGGYWYIAKPIK